VHGLYVLGGQLADRLAIGQLAHLRAQRFELVGGVHRALRVVPSLRALW
jgi:hypothetical protein